MLTFKVGLGEKSKISDLLIHLWNQEARWYPWPEENPGREGVEHQQQGSTGFRFPFLLGYPN